MIQKEDVWGKKREMSGSETGEEKKKGEKGKRGDP